MINIVITINNKTNFKLPIKKQIEGYILEVLEEKGIKGEIEIGLEFVEKNEIQELNKNYRSKNYPTDVLSFPIFDKVPQENLIPTLIGDIVICPEVMIENALKYKVTPKKELENLIKHSTLHLLGFHHKGDE